LERGYELKLPFYRLIEGNEVYRFFWQKENFGSFQNQPISSQSMNFQNKWFYTHFNSIHAVLVSYQKREL